MLSLSSQVRARGRTAAPGRLGRGVRAGEQDVEVERAAVTMEPATWPVKAKLPGEPSGSVCLSTMILPSLVLMYVQVTCSLLPTLIVATPVST